MCIWAHRFNYKHVHFGHCGPSLLLSSTANRFHIVGARRPARAVCRRCVTCRRVSAKTQSQMMGQLPASRVTPNPPPFTITGVDYAGPFTLKKDHTHKPVLIKSYISIFVCFSSKASHIEIISDLTTETFLAGLKPFITRHGLPQEIHSDNGSNFLGAKKRPLPLPTIYQHHLSCQPVPTFTESTMAVYSRESPSLRRSLGGSCESCKVSSAPCHWHSAPHIRGVRHSDLPNWELPQFSAPHIHHQPCHRRHLCLNSRALPDWETIEGLPRDHHSPGTISTQEMDNVSGNGAPLWKRWSTEYLQQLQALPKWRIITPNLQPGDIVVIRDDTPFTCHWPLARIIETFPGQDGLVRVVTLKTATTTLKRPV